MGSFWNSFKSNAVYVILGIFALNLLVLDFVVFLNKPPKPVETQLAQTPQQTTNTQIAQTRTPTTQQVRPTSTQPSQNTAASSSCPDACTTAIKNAIASITPIVITSAPAQSAPAQSTSGSTAQEYFIPFGSGSGTSQGTYSTLPALSAYVNTSLYSSISTITFEVSATIPNGNQSATIQLYNATGGYAIPNSQVSISGGTPQLLISPNITLPTGNNLYQVQINTQLNSPIVIDQARLHITTN